MYTAAGTMVTRVGHTRCTHLHDLNMVLIYSRIVDVILPERICM